LENGGNIETKALTPGPYILQVISGKSQDIESRRVYKQ
jgi:hypothetical protein